MGVQRARYDLMIENPILPFVEHRGVMVLDGGLATRLEAMGYELDDPLWSAKILMESPEAVRRVHLEFLTAGADCIIAASYQASLPGFRARGLSEEEGIELLERSVDLAVEARDEFWSKQGNRNGRQRPLVAASVGPYGAFLADGSEYTGRYAIDDDGLLEFHARRWEVLAASSADLLACETIPSSREAKVLLRLLARGPEVWAWISFSCCDAERLSDGSPFIDLVHLCDAEPKVAAVGVNCTAPRFVSGLITSASEVTTKPIVAYPNSGEKYEADRKAWCRADTPVDWESAARQWKQLGASVVGGCCRVGTDEIAAIRRSTNGHDSRP